MRPSFEVADVLRAGLGAYVRSTQSSRNQALGRLGRGKGRAGLGCGSFAKSFGRNHVDTAKLNTNLYF